MAALENTECLILEHSSDRNFIQVTAHGSARLRAIVVPNHHSRGTRPLHPEQTAILTRFGWKRPRQPASTAVAVGRSAGSAAYVLDWKRDQPLAELVELIITALRRVLGAGGPGDLRYRAFRVGGGEILLPTLGIERRRSARQRAAGEAKERAVDIDTHASLVREVREALKAVGRRGDPEPDTDGDFPCRTQAGIVFVRVLEDKPVVRLFSILAEGCDCSEAFLTEVNRLNLEHLFAAFALSQGALVMRVDVRCDPFLPESFTRLFAGFCALRDEIGDSLGREWGSGDETAGDDPLLDVNQSARRATAAWLTGEGLALAVETMRASVSEERIAAPEFEGWRSRLVEATTAACRSADAVLDAVNNEAPLSEEEVKAEMAHADRQATLAERSCRAIAQLALGVTSHTAWTDETARLERAATLVLYDAGVDIEDEDIVFLARDHEGLVTELAGLICRMLTQQDCTWTIRAPGVGATGIELLADASSNLVVRHAGVERCWSAPVRVREPATYVAELLSLHGSLPTDA
ncbi:MAG: hypothetical protein AB1625_16205 [Acidobacteriota bacterium]